MAHENIFPKMDAFPYNKEMNSRREELQRLSVKTGLRPIAKSIRNKKLFKYEEEFNN